MDMVRANLLGHDSSLRWMGTANVLRDNGSNHKYNLFHHPTVGTTDMLITEKQSAGCNSSFVKLLHNVTTIINIGGMALSGSLFKMLAGSTSVTLGAMILAFVLAV